jgi:hypothetical protein
MPKRYRNGFAEHLPSIGPPLALAPSRIHKSAGVFMAGQTTMAVFITALIAAAIILATICAAAAATWVTGATFAAIGLIEKVAPDIQLLATLSLTPLPAMLMAAMQATGLMTITQLMQEVNLVMITVTL